MFFWLESKVERSAYINERHFLTVKQKSTLSTSCFFFFSHPHTHAAAQKAGYNGTTITGPSFSAKWRVENKEIIHTHFSI